MLSQISMPEITKEKIEQCRDIVLKQCNRLHENMTGNCKDYYDPAPVKPCDAEFKDFTIDEITQAIEYERANAQLEILNKVVYNRFYYEEE
ncbi:MAG: hypothetical protein ABRQ37_26365 [Candidatus Eremiobacterota bacterium]